MMSQLPHQFGTNSWLNIDTVQCSVTRIPLPPPNDRLHKAIDARDMDGVEAALAAGADANATLWLSDDPSDPAPVTPLVVAVWHNAGDIIRRLIAAGADVHADDMAGTLAVSRGHLNALAVLLQAGLEPDVRLPSGTMLHIAAEKGHEDVVRVLLGAGASPEALDDEGRSPLFYAAQGGHAGVAQLLIRAGVAVDARDDYGQTPLHAAASTNISGVMRVLLDAGADPHARDDSGAVALHYAAMGYGNRVAVLLEAGANVEARDTHGRTAFDYAFTSNNTQAVEVLREALVARMARANPALRRAH